MPTLAVFTRAFSSARVKNSIPWCDRTKYSKKDKMQRSRPFRDRSVLLRLHPSYSNRPRIQPLITPTNMQDKDRKRTFSWLRPSSSNLKQKLNSSRIWIRRLKRSSATSSKHTARRCKLWPGWRKRYGRSLNRNYKRGRHEYNSSKINRNKRKQNTKMTLKRSVKSKRACKNNLTSKPWRMSNCKSWSRRSRTTSRSMPRRWQSGRETSASFRVKPRRAIHFNCRSSKWSTICSRTNTTSRSREQPKDILRKPKLCLPSWERCRPYSQTMTAKSSCRASATSTTYHGPQ